MLISTGLPLPMWSNISESEFAVPKSNPTWSWRICWEVRPLRVSEPVISQFWPADCPLNAGSATDRFSLESSQKYDPTVATIRATTTITAYRAIRRPRRPGWPQNRHWRSPGPGRRVAGKPGAAGATRPDAERAGGWSGQALPEEDPERDPVPGE